jgi:hypothetical protein
VTYEIWNVISALLEKVTELLFILLGLEKEDFQGYTHTNVYM